MQLYAISNSANLASGLMNRIEILRRLAAGWAEGGVHFIQIREKDLTAGELERLTSAVVREVEGSTSKVLVNGRADVALATGAFGVHLPGDQTLSPQEVRQVFATQRRGPVSISVACHSLEEALSAKTAGVSLILFAPVFEKLISEGRLPGKGVDALSSVCQSISPLPVFALGGVDKGNAAACVAAGAAGIAAIRLFQTDQWRQLLSI